MITDSSRYYGSVIHRIVEASNVSVSIARLDVTVPGFFLLNDRLPFYVKYSTARKGPWGFNFHVSQRSLLDDYRRRFGECLSVLVCAKDGMVTLSYSDLESVLEDRGEMQENVSVKRGHREMYEVKGPGGALDHKVARNSLLLALDTSLRGA